jgi:hypothetical protein
MDDGAMETFAAGLTDTNFTLVTVQPALLLALTVYVVEVVGVTVSRDPVELPGSHV